MRVKNKKEVVGELLLIIVMVWGFLVLPMSIDMHRDVVEAKSYVDDYFRRQSEAEAEKLKNSPDNVIPQETRHIPQEVGKKPENVKKQAKTHSHVERYKAEMSKIAKVAEEIGYSHVERLYRLAHCESRFDNSRTNKNTDSKATTDRGIFQYNDYWHKEVSDSCARNTECATRRTIELTRNVQREQDVQWSCRGVWLDESYDYMAL